MFTGIIEAVGTITALTPKGKDISVTVASGDLDLADVKLGDSIATNGVCLTVVQLTGSGYVADLSLETLKYRAFHQWSRLIKLRFSHPAQCAHWQSEVEVSLSQADLRTLIDKTQFSMANQDVRYYLNGMLFEIDGTTLRSVATDGHRMAVRILKCPVRLMLSASLLRRCMMFCKRA